MPEFNDVVRQCGTSGLFGKAFQANSLETNNCWHFKACSWREMMIPDAFSLFTLVFFSH